MKRFLSILLLCSLTVSANPYLPILSGSVASDTSTAWVTSTPAAATRNDFGGCVGVNFTVGGAGITVTQLGLWVISGNSQTVTVYIKNSSATTLVSASFNTAGMSPGWNYVAVTPTALSASTVYSLHRSVSDGGDLWNGEETITVTAVAAATISSFASSCDAIPSTSSAGKCFSGVNFKYQ